MTLSDGIVEGGGGGAWVNWGSLGFLFPTGLLRRHCRSCSPWYLPRRWRLQKQKQASKQAALAALATLLTVSARLAGPKTPNSLTGGTDILPVHYVQQQHCGVEEREATKSGAHYTDMGTYLSTYPYHTVQSRLVLRQSIWPAGPPMWDVGSCLSRPHFCHSLTESLTATRG